MPRFSSSRVLKLQATHLHFSTTTPQLFRERIAANAIIAKEESSTLNLNQRSLSPLANKTSAAGSPLPCCFPATATLTWKGPSCHEPTGSLRPWEPLCAAGKFAPLAIIKTSRRKARAQNSFLFCWFFFFFFFSWQTKHCQNTTLLPYPNLGFNSANWHTHKLQLVLSAPGF